MKNRIEDIVLTKDPKKKAQKSAKLQKAIQSPAGRKKVLKEFHQALDNSRKRIESIRNQIESIRKQIES